MSNPKKSLVIVAVVMLSAALVGCDEKKSSSATAEARAEETFEKEHKKNVQTGETIRKNMEDSLKAWREKNGQPSQNK